MLSSTLDTVQVVGRQAPRQDGCPNFTRWAPVPLDHTLVEFPP
jgi:hypothetical protein